MNLKIMWKYIEKKLLLYIFKIEKPFDDKFSPNCQKEDDFEIKANFDL